MAELVAVVPVISQRKEPQAKEERVLVLGAGGWFGRNLVASFHRNIPILKIGSWARDDIQVWDFKVVKDFAPTLVWNFAFLTHDRIAEFGELEYEQRNLELIRQASEAVSLDSVRAVVSVSSGAVYTSGEKETLYSQLKKIEELEIRKSAGDFKTVVIPRVFSVSGPFVKEPSGYAFSSIIRGALEGQISVEARGRVFRRYCSVIDVLKLCLALTRSRSSRVFDSGGELVEIHDLAEVVRKLLNPQAQLISRVTEDTVSAYHSDNDDWSKLCVAHNLRPATLQSQIVHVANYMNSGNHS